MAIDATPRNAAHLLRRAAWGGRPEEIAEVTAIGIEATVDRLLDPSGAPVVGEPKRRGGYDGYSETALTNWWVHNAVTSATPAIERLNWFWIGHFATSLEKVEHTYLLHRQFVTLRRLGLGRFDDLLKAVTREPAMNLWLDLHLSTLGNPNENYARELMELFSMGVGNGYAQADVVNAARALTGYDVVEDPGIGLITTAELRPGSHDYGPKTFLGHTGNFDADDIIDIIVERRECHEFVARRLWHRYAGTDPSGPVVSLLADAFAERLRIDDLLRRMLTMEDFYTDDVRNGLISQPFETIVRTVRGFRLEPLDASTMTDEEAYERYESGKWPAGMLPPWAVESWTWNTGQHLPYPPNVAGWPHNAAWLDSNRAAGRLLAGLDIGYVIAGMEHPTAEALYEAEYEGGAALTARLMEGFGVTEWSTETEAAVDAARTDEPYESLAAAFAIAFTSPEVTLA